MNFAIETLKNKSSDIQKRIEKLESDMHAPAAMRIIEIQREAIELVKTSDLSSPKLSKKLAEMQTEERKQRALYKRQQTGNLLDKRVELTDQLYQINSAISLLSLRRG